MSHLHFHLSLYIFGRCSTTWLDGIIHNNSPHDLIAMMHHDPYSSHLLWFNQNTLSPIDYYLPVVFGSGNCGGYVYEVSILAWLGTSVMDGGVCGQSVMVTKVDLVCICSIMSRGSMPLATTASCHVSQHKMCPNRSYWITYGGVSYLCHALNYHPRSLDCPTLNHSYQHCSLKWDLTDRNCQNVAKVIYLTAQMPQHQTERCQGIAIFL